ncbi:hypothetical protein M899_0438 [Bacteriovorax sp. BSW11_IV]|uniref:type II toxin-antitoxin system CcdA family antitoxin n=1 Tax=Bacteriovorax sp. BSW11_IV TaxID=1353529 RepID=UPI000389E121|nr:type II toxin-antitoxin system CcdA family antitoxin [Bacteriovorax sp. BSW11_IV]EQC45069.1 hypothetical protein M899_0438 [Bacteriovorax sp. BSW11_IV]
MSRDTEMKRVNIIISKEQHEKVHAKGLNLSAIVREALEDELNAHTITLSVTEQTKKIYMQLFEETQFSDSDFEPYLKEALNKFVEELIQKKQSALKDIQKRLKKK